MFFFPVPPTAGQLLEFRGETVRTQSTSQYLQEVLGWLIRLLSGVDKHLHVLVSAI